MGKLSSRRFLVIGRRIEKDLTSRLINPLTRPPAGGRNASGARLYIEVLKLYFLYFLQIMIPMAGEEVYRDAAPDYAGNANGEEAQVVARERDATEEDCLNAREKSKAKCIILARQLNCGRSD